MKRGEMRGGREDKSKDSVWVERNGERERQTERQTEKERQTGL